MSFFRRLFGGGSDSGGASAPALREDYKGFVVEATPFPAEGQFQVCGVISKEIGGEAKSHKFIRADRFSSREEAASFSLIKGRQIIDQNGDRVFG